MKDLTVFIALCSFPVAFFVLSTYGTVFFATTVSFTVMLAFGFIALLAIKIWGYSPTDPEGVALFDENLTVKGLFLSAGLGFLVYFLAVLTATIEHGGFIYVPKPGIPLMSEAEGYGKLLGDSLYQFTLVAPAEETLKIAGIYALHGRFGVPGTSLDEVAAVIPPIFLWAVFHTIVAGFTASMVVFAFLAGLVWYMGMRTTNSILSPIIAHATYNTLVVLLS